MGVWLVTAGARSEETATSEGEVHVSPIPRVEVVRPKSGGIPRTIEQPASIHAFESVNLYAMVSGYLKSQAVDIGSRIKKGEVLAEIDVPRDAKAVEEADSLVEQARARVDQALSLIDVAEAQYEAAEAAVQQAVLDVGRLKAERVLAEKQLTRVSGLAAERAADQRLVDEQQKALDAGWAAERASGIAIQTARSRAMAARAELKKTKTDAIAARALLRVAEASRDRLKVSLRYARIVAPFEGVVTDRTFHPGALIHSAMGGGGQPLLTFKRTDFMLIIVLAPGRSVVWTKVGDEAVVSADALDGRSFKGTLARIDQSENTERMMRVEIDLPNPDSLLYDGMCGKATIMLERNPDGLGVPPACVFERIGRSKGVVYVARDGVARRTEVKLGVDNGSLVEILSGIQPDDSVILRSGTPIEDGMRIATPS
jgi:RND family efflux transporter MFP subunit